MEDLSNAFLGAVIAILLDSIILLFGFIKYQKDKRLQYTVSERGKWRDRLYEVVKCGPEHFELAQIASLINPYQFDKDSLNDDTADINIMEDEHIWIAIHNNDKQLVYHYILLLLKFERDRAKYEMIGKKPEKKYLQKSNEYIEQVESLHSNFRLKNNI